jgi:hypothetical protein
MVQSQPKTRTNIWLIATWPEFLRVIEDPAYVQAKGYYFEGQMRVEIGVGPDHASENTILILIIGIICGLRGVPVKGLTNCSYRKSSVREAQPDVSY